MARNQKNEVLIVGLSSLSLLVLPALYYSGANSLIVGTYTIIMFIVLSTLTISMINSKKGSKEQDLQNAFELTEALTENQSPQQTDSFFEEQCMKCMIIKKQNFHYFSSAIGSISIRNASFPLKGNKMNNFYGMGDFMEKRCNLWSFYLAVTCLGLVAYALYSNIGNTWQLAPPNYV